MSNENKELTHDSEGREENIRLKGQLSQLKAENERLKTAIRAGERLRVMDAASAINEANQLREKIKEQELIIYGIEEGAEEWKSLCSDKDQDIRRLNEEIERLKAERDELIQIIQPFRKLANAVLIEREVMPYDMNRPVYSFNFADITYNDLKKVVGLIPKDK